MYSIGKLYARYTVSPRLRSIYELREVSVARTADLGDLPQFCSTGEARKQGSFILSRS